MVTRGVEHIAITVPNVEEATLFFEKALGAKVMYDGHLPSQSPVEGELAEAVFGMPKGAKWIHRRLLEVGGETKLELFQYVAEHQQRAANTYDIGLQHIAFYVDDLKLASEKFVLAGGKLYPTFSPYGGLTHEVKSHNGWIYGKTPWGTVVELVTFPS